MSWRLVYTKQAQKDAKKLAASNLKEQAEELLAILEQNPWQNPPPYEKLVGDLIGAYSRRINIQHRLVSNHAKLITVIASEAKQSQPLRLLHFASLHSQ
ncbi:Txe/YoeB family addiction module toxin [Nostoc sp. FACHB-190]|uniref:Txe/YoeB family addiction module toxin n=1 Tax=Nostoc sp. FACHB-190 TaxID=2692838 RepID=UPI001686DE9B|nr:Txe/YoeB family addiction module toxin [Nostoc sp. FACHB-190]MBD2301743.1 Txe/YoeB family addiction module toxin [Nostoc sp. FACHB-190]